jgi:hypothetical protein
VHDVHPESAFSTTSERVIAGDRFESAGATMVIGTELEAAQTVVEHFQRTPDQLYVQRTQTSEPWPRTVGGQPGTIVTFERTHEGENLDSEVS